MKKAAQLKMLSRVFGALTLMTYVLVIFGAVVRAEGAGLSCPDWPLCFGQILPSMDFGVILEWGHRTLAGIISLLLVGTLLAARRLPTAWAALGRLPWIVLLVLSIQVVLGGLTVLKLLAYWTVTLHLVFGNLFCLILLTMTLRCREALTPVATTAGPSSANRRLVFLGAALLFVQMVLGGLVSSNHAGVACLEWPTCQGDVWFPTFSGLIGLHLVHRLIAYMLSIITLGLALSARSDERLKKTALIALACVLVQVLLGVLNVVWYLPVEITALHSAFAAALVLVYTVLFREAVRIHSPQDTDLNRATGAA